MSGTIIGGVIGAIIGFFIPGVGPYWGWVIGSSIGGYVDYTQRPDVYGPRLEDLKTQTSEYGRELPLIYGTMGIAGNVFWSRIDEVAQEEDMGKGGGPSYVTYTYFASCAIAVCEGERTVHKIWKGPEKKLIWDINDPDSSIPVTFYKGSETQLPDPTMESHLGSGNVPGYRGICYVVFNRLQLSPQEDGNAVPHFFFEVGPEQIITMKEHVYPQTGSTANGPITMYGTYPYGMEAAWAIDTTRNEIWSLVRPTFGSPYTDFTKVMQIMDPDTMMVKAYINRTTENEELNDEGSNYAQQMIYDQFTDAMYLVATNSPTSIYHRHLLKYDCATRSLSYITVPYTYPAAVGELALQYDKYTGELWVLTFYGSNDPLPAGSKTICRINKATGALDLQFNPTFFGYDPTVVNQLAPRQMCFTNTPGNKVYVTVDIDQSLTGAPQEVATMWLFEFDRAFGQATAICQLAREFPTEQIGQLLWIEQKQLLYVFTADHLYRNMQDGYYPERCLTFDPTIGQMILNPALFTLQVSGDSTNFLWWNVERSWTRYFNYDKNRDLIWYYPFYIADGTEQYIGSTMIAKRDNYYIVAINPTSGNIAYKVALNSVLTPYTELYINGAAQVQGMIINEDWIGLKVMVSASQGTFEETELLYTWDEVLIRVYPPAPKPTYLWEVVQDLSLRAGLTTSQIDTSQLTDVVDGYAIASQVQARGAIESLAPAYYIDGVESDGKAKFPKRGAAVVKVIDPGDLQAHPDDTDLPAVLETRRVMDEDLPAELTLSYLNAANKYDRASKSQRRTVTKSKDTKALGLPMRFTDQKAQEIVDVNLYVAWLERKLYKFFLPYKYCALEPTDRVSINGKVMRITKVSQVSRMLLSFEAVSDESHTSSSGHSVYNPDSVVTATAPNAGNVTLPVATRLELL